MRTVTLQGRCGSCQVIIAATIDMFRVHRRPFGVVITDTTVLDLHGKSFEHYPILS